MAKKFPMRTWHLRRAFSLVEVTLALGIVSVSLLALIGLLPAGLGVLRESMEETARANIVQRVSAGLATADFASLSAGTLDFDAEGQPAAGDAEAVYRVSLQEADPSLPGMTKAGDVEQMQGHLKRIRIGIARADRENAPISWYAIQVAAR